VENGTEKNKQEDLKKEIEKKGLTCDCGGKLCQAGTGTIESQQNYNKYFEYPECHPNAENTITCE
jgi:hypothetical protein